MEKQEETERKEVDRNGEVECREGCREQDLEEQGGVGLGEIMRVSESVQNRMRVWVGNGISENVHNIIVHYTTITH